MIIFIIIENYDNKAGLYHKHTSPIFMKSKCYHDIHLLYDTDSDAIHTCLRNKRADVLILPNVKELKSYDFVDEVMLD